MGNYCLRARWDSRAGKHYFVSEEIVKASRKINQLVNKLWKQLDLDTYLECPGDETCECLRRKRAIRAILTETYQLAGKQAVEIVEGQLTGIARTITADQIKKHFKIGNDD